MSIEKFTDFDRIEDSIDAFTGKVIENLSMWLLYWRKRYYCDNVSEIKDNEYDEIERLLEELEERFPHLQVEWSPTKHLGSSNVEDYERVSHVHRPEDWRDQTRHAVTIISLIH